MLTRLFWAAAAVVLFSLIGMNLCQVGFQKAGIRVGPPAAGATGQVLWKEKSVRLEVSGLPKLPPGKVYQLWLIGPEKNPIPARTFTVTPRGELRGPDTMKYDIAKGHVFAVTMEPAGGSRVPTLPICFTATVN